MIWQILKSRGFLSKDRISNWLHPSLKSLRDPFLLTDMAKAVDRLLQVRERQESLVIFADYDLDGTSGLALLLKGLAGLGFSHVSYYQPKRLTEGYGLNKNAISNLHARGNQVILTVDLGITAVDETEFANSLGLDVIITDHHLPKETLPNAVAVVNPNRGNCASGLNHLCGAGVAFYLILALKKTLHMRGYKVDQFDPKSLLDCFVIGTVTDMVPLIDENRVLVKHGLIQLERTTRPGLRALMSALGLLGKPLTSQDVAIRFAPKLNALSRMEKGLQPIDLFLVDTAEAAENLVAEVLSNNQDRQTTQRQAEEEAAQALAKTGTRNVAFVYSPGFHQGVVGLVATKLCQDFVLPAFVGAVDVEKGVVLGSARMPDGVDASLLAAMQSISDKLVRFGGHAAAAGFEFKLENAVAVQEGLEQYFTDHPLSTSTKAWLFDAEAELEELDASFMKWHEGLSPFGTQFVAPVFFVRNLRLDPQQSRALRGGHLRLMLVEQKPGKLPVKRVALWFSVPKNHEIFSAGLNFVGLIDALVEPQWNHYNGSRTLQMLIRNLRASDSLSGEI